MVKRLMDYSEPSNIVIKWCFHHQYMGISPTNYGYLWIYGAFLSHGTPQIIQSSWMTHDP
jgi:hypothetical protein